MSLASEILRDRPVAYWPLDEVSGTLVDRSGRGQPGTVVGGLTYGASGPGALRAVGGFASGAYYSFTGIALDGTGASYEAWVYFTSLPNDSVLFGLAGNGNAYAINVAAAATSITVQGNSGGTVVTFTVPSMALNTWHHVVVTRVANVTRCYLNGVESSTGGLAQSVALTVDEVGRYSSSGSFGVNGRMAQVAVYDAALSAARVLAHYNAGIRSVGALPAILADSPAVYLTLDDPANAFGALDSSGNARHGTINGSPLLAFPGPNGAQPGAFDFDGSNDEVTLPDNALYSGASLSIEAWFQLDALLTNYVIMGKANGNSTGQEEWYLTASDVNTVGITFYNTGSGVFLTAYAAHDAPVGGWCHVAVVMRANTTLDVYVNGVLSNTASGPSGTRPDTVGLPTVGSRSSVGGSPLWFNGRIAHVAVFASALTSARVRAHYEAGRLAVGATSAAVQAHRALSPLGLWSFDEIGGATALDRSGNQRHATLASTYRRGVPGPRGRRGTFLNSGSASVAHNAALNPGTTMSLGVWARFAAAPSDKSLVVKSTAGSLADGYGLYIVTGGVPRFYINAYNVAGSNIADTQVIPGDGLWHHYMGTCDGSTLRFYRDGVLAASTAYTGGAFSPSTTSLQIGTYPGSGTAVGDWSLVSLYGSALTAAQVLALYQAGIETPRPPWHVDIARFDNMPEVYGLLPSAGAPTGFSVASGELSIVTSAAATYLLTDLLDTQPDTSLTVEWEQFIVANPGTSIHGAAFYIGNSARYVSFHARTDKVQLDDNGTAYDAFTGDMVRWRRIRVTISGTTLNVYVDDAFAYTRTIIRSTGVGGIQFGQGTGSATGNWKIRNVRVCLNKALAPPAPAVIAGF